MQEERVIILSDQHSKKTRFAVYYNDRSKKATDFKISVPGTIKCVSYVKV